MCTYIILLITSVFLISQSESFNNPVLTVPDAVARPSVINYNGSVFMVTSDYAGTGTKTMFSIYESTNLQNWTKVGSVFNNDVYPTWTNADYYQSATFHYREETGDFFVFFAVWVESIYRIGASKSKSIYGPYTPEPQLLEINPGYNQWFPGIISYDGESYVLWSTSEEIIKAKRINLDTLMVYDEEEIAIITPTFDWELDNAVAPRYVRRNNQHYILYTNGGGCVGGGQSLSAIGIAKSSNLVGPYTKLEIPLLNTTLSNIWATAYGTIVNDPNNNADAIVYGGTPVGSTVCRPSLVNVNYIEWDADGWPHVLTE